MKNGIESVFKSKSLVLLLLFTPLLSLTWTALSGVPAFEANPVEYLLLETGEAAMIIFLIVLWTSPIKTFFPKSKLIKLLFRHRRWVGVGSFAYAMLHLTVYVLDTVINEGLLGLLENLSRFFILSGTIAFFILLVLSVTSANWAVKKLGGKRWKKLHRIGYLGIFLVFLHVLAKEKSNVIYTLAYFLPFALAQGYRLYKYWSPSPKASSSTSQISNS